MKASYHSIASMHVIWMCGNLGVMGRIIVSEQHGSGGILIMVAVTEPSKLSCHEDDGFTNFQ